MTIPIWCDSIFRWLGLSHVSFRTKPFQSFISSPYVYFFAFSSLHLRLLLRRIELAEQHFRSGWAAAYALHAFSIKCERHFPRNGPQAHINFGEKCFLVRQIWRKPSTYATLTFGLTNTLMRNRSKTLGLGMFSALRRAVLGSVFILVCAFNLISHNAIYKLGPFTVFWLWQLGPNTPKMTAFRRIVLLECVTTVASLRWTCFTATSRKCIAASCRTAHLSVRVQLQLLRFYTFVVSFRISCFRNGGASVECVVMARAYVMHIIVMKDHRTHA